MYSSSDYSEVPGVEDKKSSSKSKYKSKGSFFGKIGSAIGAVLGFAITAAAFVVIGIINAVIATVNFIARHKLAFGFAALAIVLGVILGLAAAFVWPIIIPAVAAFTIPAIGIIPAFAPFAFLTAGTLTLAAQAAIVGLIGAVTVFTAGSILYGAGKLAVGTYRLAGAIGHTIKEFFFPTPDEQPATIAQLNAAKSEIKIDIIRDINLHTDDKSGQNARNVNQHTTDTAHGVVTAVNARTQELGNAARDNVIAMTSHHINNAVGNLGANVKTQVEGATNQIKAHVTGAAQELEESIQHSRSVTREAFEGVGEQVSNGFTDMRDSFATLAKLNAKPTAAASKSSSSSSSSKIDINDGFDFITPLSSASKQQPIPTLSTATNSNRLVGGTQPTAAKTNDDPLHTTGHTPLSTEPAPTGTRLA